MTRATDALNDAIAQFENSTCTHPGCKSLAPDPGKTCDRHLRENAPFDLRQSWHDPEDWLNGKAPE